MIFDLSSRIDFQAFELTQNLIGLKGKGVNQKTGEEVVSIYFTLCLFEDISNKLGLIFLREVVDDEFVFRNWVCPTCATKWSTITASSSLPCRICRYGRDTAVSDYGRLIIDSLAEQSDDPRVH